MRISLSLLASLLVVFTAGEGCKNSDTEPCTFAHQVTVDSQCYAGDGLKFTAGDYGDKPLSFEWSIYALKDSSTISGWTPKDEKIRMIASNSFVVPDSLVTNYQRLIVTVGSNCGGLLKYSAHYGFIKKKATTSNCTIWVSQIQ
ncbi:hypothetical protein [Spirosoma endophyticum]|uniref:Uncharacterized protein n=1 Tax=Spirosoma endophyticum TaxID=662367 RepID=A0A1I2E354_9BACT|nr:hypothetical protein [Spirosoma endophyticum]SFE87086.1 hypothetical protein SAMN05216167_1212 [Spirosoma endophyticum]